MNRLYLVGFRCRQLIDQTLILLENNYNQNIKYGFELNYKNITEIVFCITHL